VKMGNDKLLWLVGIGALLLLASQNSDAMINEAETMTSGKTRGERNNNPGNIRGNQAYTWQGQIGIDTGGYVIFDSAENGIRAIGKDLLTKFSRGINTVQAIISLWAPTSENNTASYIRAVASQIGVDSNEELNMTDFQTLESFIQAIIQHENGRVLYSLAQLNNGVTLALNT
jgi:hypothetical protein